MPKTKKTAKKTENSESKVPRKNIKRTPKTKNTEPLKKQPGRKAKKNIYTKPVSRGRKKKESQQDDKITNKTTLKIDEEPIKFICGSCERDMQTVQ